MTISFTLIGFLKLFSFIISEKVVLNREELSPYECGFEHHNVSRIPFSLRYFFLTLIFLLFDLEIVLMLFVPFSIFSSSF
jgi:NADH-ubiquinone oxidoreductase chain 3